MSQDLQDADLPGHPLDVGLLHYLGLLQGLDCHLLAGGGVRPQPYFPERALPDGLACLGPSLPTRYCPRVNYELMVILTTLYSPIHQYFFKLGWKLAIPTNSFSAFSDSVIGIRKSFRKW